MQFQININDIGVILLSIVFPLIIKWQEKLDKEIGVYISQFWVYLNKDEVNSSENYYRFRGVLIPNQKEMIKFLTREIQINNANPYLVAGSGSGRDYDLLKNFQIKISGCSIKSEWLERIQYVILTAIILILVLS